MLEVALARLIEQRTAWRRTPQAAILGRVNNWLRRLIQFGPPSAKRRTRSMPDPVLFFHLGSCNFRPGLPPAWMQMQTGGVASSVPRVSRNEPLLPNQAAISCCSTRRW
jgi:hypothetical protein